MVQSVPNARSETPVFALAVHTLHNRIGRVDPSSAIAHADEVREGPCEVLGIVSSAVFQVVRVVPVCIAHWVRAFVIRAQIKRPVASVCKATREQSECDQGFHFYNSGCRLRF